MCKLNEKSAKDWKTGESNEKRGTGQTFRDQLRWMNRTKKARIEWTVTQERMLDGEEDMGYEEE